MPRNSKDRKEREVKIKKYILSNPEVTDGDLASCFGVSINTIRLDRARLGIKELKERLKEIVKDNTDKIESLSKKDIVGDIIEFKKGKKAVSMLKTKDYMAFEKSNVVTGSNIYAMAESLAISLIPSKVALVGIANIKYVKPVYSSEVIYAFAEVKKKRDTNYIVWVNIKDKNNDVRFKGKYILKGII